MNQKEQKEMKVKAQALIDFIYDSPTAFHAVENVCKKLEENKFVKLDQGKKWSLKKGGKYYTASNDSAVVAFIVGTEDIGGEGFRIIGAHTDSPTFKIKPANGVIIENTYVKLNTEPYGGAIFSTWFDRPLALAGKVVLKSDHIFKPVERMININRPIMVIPNLAIHFNREVNNGYKYNAQTDLLPLLGLVNGELEKEDYLLNLLCREMKVKKADILDFELFLYEFEKGSVIGAEEEFISSSRLDDLWMAHAGLEALLDSRKIRATKVLALFDHEEVGSGSAHGAASMFLRNTLSRINLAFGGSEEDFLRAMANTVAVSADLAHGVHPNYGDKHDPTNRPVLGKGPVIKYSAKQLYITTARSAAIFAGCCEKAGVPVQRFANRSDAAGGSTIAKFISGNLCADVVDMGTPVLGMHSIRELGTVIDNHYILKAFQAFYSS